MTENGIFRRMVAAALLSALLSACGTSDDTIGRFLVAPDKFVLYSCAELAERATALAERQRELERLIAKAGDDAGGRLVSTVAYRSDYVSVRGEMNELRTAAAAKNCKLAPGAENPGGRAGGSAVR